MEENITYEKKPEIVSVSRSGKSVYTSVNFNITEVEGGYTCETITLKTDSIISENNYGELVSKIIRSRYSSDEVEAILCNYNMENPTASAKRDMEVFQNWRDESKKTATEAIEYIKTIKGEQMATETVSSMDSSFKTSTENSKISQDSIEKKSLWKRLFSKS